MANEFWMEYVKHCYGLVLESEGNNNLLLDHEVEAYVVHLMAKNFNRTNIGATPVSIQLMTALAERNNKEKLLTVADECLLIQSFPLGQDRWPSQTYYQEMGIIAYGVVGHIMERNFEKASRVMHGVFNKNMEKMLKFN